MPPSAFALLEAGTGRVVAARDPEVRAFPGSTVKPFVPVAGFFPCAGTLRIGVRHFDCTHPPARGPLTREEAIALSCNCYFAAAALSIPVLQLRQALHEFDAELAETPAQRQLQAIGSWGVSASPLSMARAYRRLLRTAAKNSRLPAGFTGKTGTTAGAAWYAGWAPESSPRQVVAVLTGGRGATDAKPAAGEILSRWL
jgi:cell division protein FtsI/penicillin-binding protein 2